MSDTMEFIKVRFNHKVDVISLSNGDVAVGCFRPKTATTEQDYTVVYLNQEQVQQVIDALTQTIKE